MKTRRWGLFEAIWTLVITTTLKILMSTLHLAKSEVNKYCYHILNNTWVLEHFHYGYLVITLLSLLLLSLVCACTHVCSLSSFVLICPPRLAIYFFSFVSCIIFPSGLIFLFFSWNLSLESSFSKSRWVVNTYSLYLFASIPKL